MHSRRPIEMALRLFKRSDQQHCIRWPKVTPSTTSNQTAPKSLHTNSTTPLSLPSLLTNPTNRIPVFESLKQPTLFPFLLMPPSNSSDNPDPPPPKQSGLITRPKVLLGSGLLLYVFLCLFLYFFLRLILRLLLCLIMCLLFCLLLYLLSLSKGLWTTILV